MVGRFATVLQPDLWFCSEGEDNCKGLSRIFCGIVSFCNLIAHPAMTTYIQYDATCFGNVLCNTVLALFF